MSAIITPALLRAIGTKEANANLYAPLLEKARVVPGDGFNTITSRMGVAMLVSQLAHESAWFSTLSENLNYSVHALQEGNRAKYFTPVEAKLYGYVRTPDGTVVQKANQEMIANLYYGGRLGNYGVSTRDGWNFRGGGLIQLTGRENFTEFGRSVNMSPEKASEYARTPEGAVASALWFWRTRNLLIPASRGDVTRCTEIIQGASGGLSARISLFKSSITALG